MRLCQVIKYQIQGETLGGNAKTQKIKKVPRPTYKQYNYLPRSMDFKAEVYKYIKLNATISDNKYFS